MDASERLHLIGSIPLESSEQVFRTLAQELGPWLRRFPDGETGERSRWVYFQGQMLRAHPDMEIDPTVPPYPFVQWDGKVIREINQVRFKPGIDPASVAFETGYSTPSAFIAMFRKALGTTPRRYFAATPAS